MKLINARPLNSAIAWTTTRPKRGDWRLTIIVKAAYRLIPGGVAAADETAPVAASGDDPAEPNAEARYASDFVPYKPRADFMVAGTAYTPGGVPASSCRVSMAIGGWRKSLTVTGDRHWIVSPLGTRPSEPVPFVTMPVSYQRAFGGARDRRNPVGCGTQRALPNIERSDQLITTVLSRPDPAGFGPIGLTWQPRIGHAGTYDAAWLRHRWPWFPADFNWAFFNAAPADQQFPNFRGDEALGFENLHPGHATLRCRLPGVAARIFVEREQSFEEVVARLDTIWADPAAERLVLVWRGVTAVSSPRLRQLASLCATLEPLAASASVAAHHAAFMTLKNGAEAATAAQTTAERAAFEQVKADLLQRVAGSRAKRADALAEQAETTNRPEIQAWLAQRRSPPTEPAASDPTASLARLIEAVRKRDPARAQTIEERLQTIDRTMQVAMDRDKRFPVWTADRVATALAEGTSLARAKLDKLDLATLDLSGADLREATLVGTRLAGARLDRADLSGADLRQADLAEASFVATQLGGANLSGAHVAGTVFTGAKITQAIFVKLDMAGLDFSDCRGDGPDFTGAVLAGAHFCRAVLGRAQFGGADVSGADFTAATLHAADFAAAKGRGVVMERADLTNLRAMRGAQFSEGRFAGCLAPRSNWQQALLEGADFSRAVLTEALFPEADLSGATFDRAQLQSACFDDARLVGARLTNANLLRTSLMRADLTDAVVESSNLYAAGLLDAVLHGATFRGSFLDRVAGAP